MKKRKRQSAFEREFQDFSATMPIRFVKNADSAFSMYVAGALSREEFDYTVSLADLACRQELSPIKPRHIPTWFKKRLVRALGPECFGHLTFASDWLVNYGSTKLPVEIKVDGGLYGTLTAIQANDVFVVEPIRPWVIDKEILTKFTEEKFAAAQKTFLDMLDRLLDQPRRLADATRCELLIYRAAFTGWANLRLIFKPFDIQEDEVYTPESFDLRTCSCDICTKVRFMACTSVDGRYFWRKAGRGWPPRTTDQLNEKLAANR